MQLSAVLSLIDADPLADVAACRRELEHVRAVRGAVDARELKVLGRLDELASESPIFPEEEVAKAAKSSLSRATRVRARKKACDDVPAVGDALAKGDTTGDRVDALAKATAGMTADELARMAEHGAQIADAAANASDRAYRELLERIAGKARENDGLDRLERQRRACRLRWSTGADGMWRLSGAFDPVQGTEMEGRLRNVIEGLFHGNVPEVAPVDPFERQEYLAALALMSIFDGTATASGVPDVTVVIDAETLLNGCRHDRSIVDAGLGRFGLPIETVRRWACVGTVTPVVVGDDGVRLFLGRETRLANRAQRRALRVLYRTCALCDVPFEHTQAHHVSWFGLQQGLTDIDNLVPLCSQHHHRVHEGGWQLHLAPDRTLTVVRPGGVTSAHGPPRARAA